MKSAKKWFGKRGRARSKSKDDDEEDAGASDNDDDSNEAEPAADDAPAVTTRDTTAVAKDGKGGGRKDWKAKYKAAKKQILILEQRNSVLMQMVIDARMQTAKHAQLHRRAQGKYDAIRYELARKNIGIEDDSGDEGGGTFADLDANDIAEELGRGLGTGANGGSGGDGAADTRPEAR